MIAATPGLGVAVHAYAFARLIAPPGIGGEGAGVEVALVVDGEIRPRSRAQIQLVVADSRGILERLPVVVRGEVLQGGLEGRTGPQLQRGAPGMLILMLVLLPPAESPGHVNKLRSRARVCQVHPWNKRFQPDDIPPLGPFLGHASEQQAEPADGGVGLAIEQHR